MVVWARDLYAMEIQRQLDNETYYKVDPSYSLDKDVNKIRKTINEFIKNGSLEENATLLNVPNVRQPTFYVLPKIHKEDNPGRPIVSAVSCPTAHISSYLDSIFQPLVQSLPSFIKDSTDALKKFIEINNNRSFQPTLLCTMDVSGLYTNIPHNDGLLALQFFLDQRDSLYPPTDTILRLAELVLSLNTFSFGDAFYHQLSGVAMGTKMGPSYACLFMGHLEQSLFTLFSGTKPEFNGRYIDDCLIITSLQREEMLAFISFANDFHPSIKFTHELSSSKITFLDIQISIVEGTISTSVFYKPTDSHSYLDYNSSHSLATRNSIPFSQFLRLRRLCSSDEIFREKGKEMCTFFQSRNYPESIVYKAFQKVSKIPRQVCMQPTPKTSSDRPILVIPFHPHNIPVKKLFTKIGIFYPETPLLANFLKNHPLWLTKEDKTSVII